MRCCFADNQAAEAKYLADTVQELHKRGVPYREVAVLYRAHYVTRALEEALIEAKLPYTIYSGVQFFRPDGDQGRTVLPAPDCVP